MLKWRALCYWTGVLWLTFIWWANHHRYNGRVWRCLQNWLQLALIGALPLGGTPDLTWVWRCSCCFSKRGRALVWCRATRGGSVGGRDAAGIEGGRAAGCCVLMGWCCCLSCRSGPCGGATATHRARFHQEEAATVLRGCADGRKYTTGNVFCILLIWGLNIPNSHLLLPFGATMQTEGSFNLSKLWFNHAIYS